MVKPRVFFPRHYKPCYCAIDFELYMNLYIEIGVCVCEFIFNGTYSIYDDIYLQKSIPWNKQTSEKHQDLNEFQTKSLTCKSSMSLGFF